MASTGISKDDAAAVMQVLTDYYRIFSTLDLQKTLTFFHEPSLRVGPQGVFGAPTHADMAVDFSPTLEALRSRGYGRSELTQPKLNMLNATAALVIGVAERFKTDGQPLDRAGVTYVLQKVDASWKIAVLVLHYLGYPKQAIRDVGNTPPVVRWASPLKVATPGPPIQRVSWVEVPNKGLSGRTITSPEDLLGAEGLLGDKKYVSSKFCRQRNVKWSTAFSAMRTDRALLTHSRVNCLVQRRHRRRPSTEAAGRRP